MATIYTRIKYLESVGKIRGLTQAEKLQTGKVIAGMFFPYPHPAIQRHDSIEPEGTFSVWSYPRKFKPTIDNYLIENFRPKRRRLPTSEKVRSNG